MVNPQENNIFASCTMNNITWTQGKQNMLIVIEANNTQSGRFIPGDITKTT